MSVVRAVIEVATLVSYPTQAQLSGWTNYTQSGGSVESMAAAFVQSTVFGNLYNKGTEVDPNSAVTDQILNGIIQHATGALPSLAQEAGWLNSGASVLQVFEAFALGDQFGVAAQPDQGHPLPGGYDPFPEYFQIAQLGTGEPFSGTTLYEQFPGWLQYDLLGGSLHSIEEAFVGSSIFADRYNSGITVNPDSPITQSLAEQIITNALGTTPTTDQVNAWAHTGMSVVGVFDAFALGDQFAAYTASHIAFV